MRTIRECLAKLDEHELTNLGFRLLVEPPGDGVQKKYWVALIEEALTGDPGEVYGCLTLFEWQAIERHLNGVPGGKDPNLVSIREANGDPDLRSALQSLRELGLSWRDRQAWHLTDYARVIVPRSRLVWEELEENQRQVSMLEGYLRIYGMAPAGFLLQQVIPDSQDAQKDERHRDMLMALFRRRWGLYGFRMHDGTLWMVGPEVEDADKLFSQLFLPQARGLAYAAYTQEEALWCGTMGVPGREKDYEDILRFYARQGLGQLEALDVLDEALVLCQQGMTDMVMEVLTDPLPKAPTPGDVRLLSSVMLRVPLWQFKGHSMQEMMPTPRREKVRAKQNELCPCGSGRLYKHCCGRFQ